MRASSGHGLPRATIGVPLAAGALLMGALAAAAFAPALALLVGTAIIGAIVAHPRQSVIALALASPFYDLVVIRAADVADIRILEIFWMVAAGALVWRAATGRPERLGTPPKWFTVGLCGIVGWFAVAALLSGGGVRPYIEVMQTAYLAMVGYLVAAVFSASDMTELRRWLRPWAFLMSGVLLVSLAGYVLGMHPVARTVVTVPAMSVEYVQRSVLVQGAGSDGTEISRIGILNLGPVGTAAMLVSMLAVSSAFSFSRLRRNELVATLAITGLGSIVLLLAYSRAGWLVVVVAVALVLLKSGQRKAAVVLAVLIVVLAIVANLPSVSPRLEELADPGEGSYQAHGRLWVTALYMIEARPIFGWGPGMYAENADALGINSWMAIDISADQPHNWVLEVSAETGIVGGSLAVLFVGTILVYGWRSTRDAPLPAFAVWVATGCYVAMNLTLNAFRTETTWVWFGVLIGVAAWYDVRRVGTTPPDGGAELCE